MKNDHYPLNLSQTGVYLESIDKSDSLQYNTPFYIILPKNTDIGKLTDSVKKVTESHPSFHMNVKIYDEIPCMSVCTDEIVIQYKNTDDIESEINSFVKPFDLEKEPLCRFEICTAPNGVYLLFDCHHIIFDGTSISLMFRQITDVYSGKDIEAEKVTLFDISESEKNIRDTEKYKEAQDYFRKEFEGVSFDSAPQPDCITKEEVTGAAYKLVHTKKYFSTENVEKFVRKAGISENTFFMTAFGYTLAKMNGTAVASFCTASAGRYKKNLESTTGMFVKTIPIVFEFDEKAEIEKYLADTQREFYKEIAYDCIDFGELAREYGVNNEVSFIYQAELFSGSSLNGKKIPVNYIAPSDIMSSIQVMLFKDNSDYRILLFYKKSLYTRDFAGYFIRLYINVLLGMMGNTRFSEIQLVDTKTRELLDKLNKTECEWNEGSTLIELFRSQAEKTPDNTCLVYRDKRFSYREINEITDRLACFLIKKGIRKEKIVGILVPRCEYMLICALGVLKAGGAYMPLDPTYPPERLNLMTADSEAEMLIADPELSGMIDSSFKGLRIMTDEINEMPPRDIEMPEPSPDDLFILLYTSGSTGKPKGVMYTHSNALVSAEYFRTHFELDENSNNACYASYGFDACSMEMFPTITSGGALHIIPEEIRLELLMLRDYFNKEKITHCILTTQVCRQFAVLGGLTSLKHLSAAGEKLTPLEPPRDFKMYNLYGPTEGSCITSGFTIDRYYKDVPIGKAVDNLKVYITDTLGRLLPPYAVGELWITGPHVTKGYMNMPEKTNEVYGDNPFLDDKTYSRSYHTGDIVRMLPDGNMQFIGRRDAQVKIRGFRIELTEIEEVIRRFSDIKDAFVTAFDSSTGGKYIAAYVVSDKEIQTEQLCEFIRSEKPPYMVPEVIMQIDSIPLTQNQKVNKKALPLPQRKTEKTSLPETEIQKQLFDIAAECIGHSEFGTDTDLYFAGLTSIGILKMNIAISKAFGVNIKIFDIKKNCTVKKLEKYISESEKAEQIFVQNDYPLTQTQLGIFVECISNPDTTIYNMPMLFRLGKGVQPNRLESAVKAAIDAHPYIKTQLFTNSDGDVRARRNDDMPSAVDVVYCSRLPESNKMVKPFRLLDSPLYRAVIFNTNEGCWLFLDICHIINDGVSTKILLDSIDRAYKGEKLEKEKFSGFEAAVEEQKLYGTEAHSRAEEYYKALLEGCDTECLPPRSAFRASHGAEVSILDSQTKFEDVSEFCQKMKITPNTFFIGVFGFVLGSFSAKSEFVYTTLYNGRNDSRLSETISMLVKTIPVAVKLDDSEKIAEYLKKVQSQLNETMANDAFSFAEIADVCHIKSDILFVYQGNEFEFDSLCGEKAELLPFRPQTAKVPLAVNVYVKNGTFELDAEYEQEYFSRNFIENLLYAVSAAVDEFIVRNLLGEVSMLTDFAWEQYGKMNASEIDFEDTPVYELIMHQAELHPEKCAVIADGEKLTYSELVSASERIADSLIKLGAGDNEIIGIILDRTKEIPIAETGIMMAGCAFLPMLPSYPYERIEYCLKDAECRFVITTEAVKKAHADIFSDDENCRILTVEELLKNGEDTVHDTAVSPDATAYCIYTSGSTGTPKGVMISHHNFTNFAVTQAELYSYYSNEECDGCAMALSSICFDMSLYEIYNCLCNGKTLCIATENEIHNPPKLRKLMTENKAQFLSCTPSFLSNILSFPEFVPAIMGLRTLVAGAEAFPQSLFETLRQTAPSLQIINGYGPTECTICSSLKQLTDSVNITIGRPTGNIKMYVADKKNRILPPYAMGELIICGDCVGKGYVKMPEKTKASFFTLRGMPAYHSGDLVRINEDSEIEFFGRIDNQVKIRGFRVEPDEIENAMRSFEGVKQSKVIVRNNGSEDYLAGFFTAEQQIDTDILIEYLKSKLTYYMVPAVIMQLDEMPLNASGKIDRSKLPEIRRTDHRSKKRAPKKSLEERLCELFKSVLSLEECFADDNFFELGGTSLSASKVTMKLMSENVKIEYGDIFSHPTPESLAEFIESQNSRFSALSENTVRAYTDNPALRYNVCKYANQVKRESLGNVLLTGAAGFLGIHVLRELISLNEGHIWCMIRKGHFSDEMARLKMLLMYYFDDTFDDELNERITIINADITDENLEQKLADIPFDTIINCAACVKHFASDDILERVNVGGVENMISVCRKNRKKLIQISTVSVCGVYHDGVYENPPEMYENDLFMLESMDNKYIISKYHAEQKIFDAVRTGLRAKVIRVGNLMGRYSDGEFQINADTNMFLSGIRGFAAMGMYPISHMTDPMSFSPVDCTAKAIVLLAGTNDMFTAFNADSRYGFDEMKLIDACNACGIKIEAAEDEKYYAEYHKALGDSEMNGLLNGLAAYDRSDMHTVNTDNEFTTNILYRLGFSWPLIDDSYLERVISALKTLGYFDIKHWNEKK